MMTSIRTMTVNRSLVVALLNADCSGINKEDLDYLNEFNALVGTDTIDIKDDDTIFTKCDITGLHNDCLLIDLVKFQSTITIDSSNPILGFPELRQFKLEGLGHNPNWIQLGDVKLREGWKL